VETNLDQLPALLFEICITNVPDQALTSLSPKSRANDQVYIYCRASETDVFSFTVAQLGLSREIEDSDLRSSTRPSSISSLWRTALVHNIGA
jgi:hypothetical protein